MKRVFKTLLNRVWNTSLDWGCVLWGCWSCEALGGDAIPWLPQEEVCCGGKGLLGHWMQSLETGVLSVLTAQSWVVQITYQVSSFLLHLNQETASWVGMTRTGITWDLFSWLFAWSNFPRDWRSALCPRHGDTFLPPEFQTPLNRVLHSWSWWPLGNCHSYLGFWFLELVTV